MVTRFGQAARNAASDIAKRRRGNPDPDGVIANQVAQSIIQNSSAEIGNFLQQQAAAMPPPRPPAPPPNPYGDIDSLMSMLGGGGAAMPNPALARAQALMPPVAPPTPVAPIPVFDTMPPAPDMRMPSMMPASPSPRMPMDDVRMPMYDIPAPSPLIPGQQEQLDPQLVMILRELGLI